MTRNERKELNHEESEPMTTPQATVLKAKPEPHSNSNGHQAADAGQAGPALPFDLTTLPDEALAALAEAAPRELARRKTEREEAFLKEIREGALALGLTPARLAAALAGKSARARASTNASNDGRRSVKPLLWNPLDHSQKWSKRGARPAWLVEHLAAGGTEEECVIPEGAV
jgi:DNA-binding protein H-NS